MEDSKGRPEALLIPASAWVTQANQPVSMDGVPASIPAQVIKKPTKEEIARIETGQTCGNCDSYEYDTGQAELRRQKFFERCVHDERWKREWLENPGAMGLKQFGLCGQSDDTAVPAMAPACPEWRPRRRGLVRMIAGKIRERLDRF